MCLFQVTQPSVSSSSSITNRIERMRAPELCFDLSELGDSKRKQASMKVSRSGNAFGTKTDDLMI